MRLPDTFVEAWGPGALGLLRVVTGFMFMAHGMQKILGFPVGRATQTVLLSLSGVAGLMELIGGALILLGLFTRPVAFLLSGEMAFAYFMAHAPQGFWPLLNRGELAALYSFVFLFLAVAGGGAWSLDRALWNRQSRDASDASRDLRHRARGSAQRERFQVDAAD